MNEPGNATLPSGDFNPQANPDHQVGIPKDANQEIGVPKSDAGGASRDMPKNAPGWYNRRYLPHFDDFEKIQHITFHLADSLANEVLEIMEDEIRRMPKDKKDVERRKKIEAWLDAGHGSCILREPAIAEMVQNALFFFEGQRYHLLAWVVMPNHVHVLLQTINGWTHAKVVASWKKWTATHICAHRRLGNIPGNANLLSGAFSGTPPGNANLLIGAFDSVPQAPKPDRVWHRECWDRYIRSEEHLQRAADYIHQNPVKARLVAEPSQWPWSSAGNVPGNVNLLIGNSANGIMSNMDTLETRPRDRSHSPREGRF